MARATYKVRVRARARGRCKQVNAISGHEYSRVHLITTEIGALVPDVGPLDPYEAISLQSVRVHSEWTANGLTVPIESEIHPVIDVAVRNGWTGTASEAVSMLAAVYRLGGDELAAENAAAFALSIVSLSDSVASMVVTYQNLALAALATGRLTDAATLLKQCLVVDATACDTFDELNFLRAELLIRQGRVEQGTILAKKAYEEAGRTSRRRFAVAARVLALGLSANGESRRATSLIKQSFDSISSGCLSWLEVQRIHSAYQQIVLAG